jgi:D-3-phosphoglycerate dehydrogenase / 2-oxoglutarate reductase
MKSFSFPKEKMRFLFLEGVDASGSQYLASQGYSCDCRPVALDPSDLKNEIEHVHVLGIRSKTTITKDILEHARSLWAIGCFSVGTNQVDLEATAQKGIVVFNAPFSNTRSVAELTLAEIIMLSRKAPLRSQEMHAGVWVKSAKNCYEIRGKTVGIIGYGKIGPQVGVLAESLGMTVLYYDIAPKLPLGNAKACKTLDDLLAKSHFVTLHVPETAQTHQMIGERELSLIRRGGYILNLSRGTVVDIPALRSALLSGHLEGAAIDVFPKEPKSNNEAFESELQGLPNVILTPHIGSGTMEAQRNIGLEVSEAILRYIETGTTSGAVNFPQLELPIVDGSHRVLNVHANKPGALGKINQVLATLGANIRAQYLETKGEIGYLIMDVDTAISSTVKTEIDALDVSIKTRLLF